MPERGTYHFNQMKAANHQAVQHAFAMLKQMQEHVKGLEHALEDAINSPKGVVPDSAVEFWDGQRGRVRQNTLEG